MSISPNQISLTPNQQLHLARLAEQTGKPWNAVLEEALTSFEHGVLTAPENGETVHDAMLRLGLLGAVQDGPVDLSTNPEYMEGFGEHRQ
jgi:hypothetical protein